MNALRDEIEEAWKKYEAPLQNMLRAKTFSTLRSVFFE